MWLYEQRRLEQVRQEMEDLEATADPAAAKPACKSCGSKLAGAIAAPELHRAHYQRGCCTSALA